MGRAKKLRSLKWQENKLQEDINQSLDELMEKIAEKKKDGDKNDK